MEQRTIAKRQTAHHVWISMILNGKYVKQLGEWDPNYIEYQDMQIGRINIIGTIVGKYSAEDNTYVAFTIDDGSAAIRIKAWREDAMAIEKHKVGDHVLVIGKPREYNEEIYVSPEVVKLVEDPNEELLRKVQLFNKFGKVKFIEHNPTQAGLAQSQPTMTVTNSGESMYQEEKLGEETIGEEEHVVTEFTERAPMKQELEKETPAETERAKVLALIEKLAGEDGAAFDEVVLQSGLNEEQVEVITQELLKEGEIYQNRPGRLSILG